MNPAATATAPIVPVARVHRIRPNGKIDVLAWFPGSNGKAVEFVLSRNLRLLAGPQPTAEMMACVRKDLGL